MVHRNISEGAGRLEICRDVVSVCMDKQRLIFQVSILLQNMQFVLEKNPKQNKLLRALKQNFIFLARKPSPNIKL